MAKKDLLFLFFACICLVSCELESLDGDWESIKVSKSKFEASAEGGTFQTRCLNYGGWWLEYVSVDSAGFSRRDYRQEEYGWGTAEITKNNGPVLTMKVNPNNGKRRTIGFHLSVGDAFTYVEIVQAGKQE